MPRARSARSCLFPLARSCRFFLRRAASRRGRSWAAVAAAAGQGRRGRSFAARPDYGSGNELFRIYRTITATRGRFCVARPLVEPFSRPSLGAVSLSLRPADGRRERRYEGSDTASDAWRYLAPSRRLFVPFVYAIVPFPVCQTIAINSRKSRDE